MVAAHVPAVWTTATPATVLEARARGVDATLRAILGELIHDPRLARAAEPARTAAGAATLPGHPLAAANAALPWPEEPHMVLWQAANSAVTVVFLVREIGLSPGAIGLLSTVFGYGAVIIVAAAAGLLAQTRAATR